MRKLFTLFILSAFLFMPNIGKANTVTIGENFSSGTRVIPVSTSSQNSSTSGPVYDSFSQQIYLASELNANASGAKNFSAITFYLSSGSGTAVNRNLQVWIKETDENSFAIDGSYPYKPQVIYESVKESSITKHRVGTKVFDGTVDIGSNANYTITFNQNGNIFAWGGTKNIIVTIIDKTNSDIPTKAIRHIIGGTDSPRFLHHWETSSVSSGDAYEWVSDADFYHTHLGDTWTSTYSPEGQTNGHKWVNKITFTYDGGAGPTPPATPSNLSVIATTTTSASLSWSSVGGATSYDLEQSANGENWSTLSLGETGTSYNWTGLSAASTQYARIRANNSDGSSDWSDPVTVTTDAVHEHDGITFNKWTSANSLPSSGNYYLDANVELGYVGPDLTLSGDLNLCLNGKTANLGIFKIIVPDEKTLTIYDNVGGGKITSIVPGQIEAFEVNYQSVIVVRSGGTLVLKEGVIENNYEHNPEDPSDEYYSYAICSNGAIHLSGDVLINSNDIDIYLHESKVITLDGALSNAEKHTVYILGGAFTSGWSTYMSGADPRDYFESANSAKSVCLSGGEAALQTLLNLSESAQNSAIGTNDGQVVDVNLARPLVDYQYNTFCLPFALSNAQLEEYFGAGYELWELESSSLDGEQLSLAFERKYALEAGKPYLLQPSAAISSVMFFDDVTIDKDLSNTATEYIDFHGTYAPTELAGGNKNLLFLGANNELFWPESTGNIKGFRAYFEVKPSAGAAKRARIVKKEEGATGIGEVRSENAKAARSEKILRNGQLLILRDNKTYNVLGMEYGK